MKPLVLPLWLRCLAAGLIWAGFMYAFVADGPRTVLQGLIYLGGGVLFGLAFWAWERRTFENLTGSERSTVITAVSTARPPDDERLAGVAMRVATRWATPTMRPVHQIIVFGLFLLLSVYVAVAVTPWAWFGLLFWPLAAWYSVRFEGRRQRAAERYLDLTSQPAELPS